MKKSKKQSNPMYEIYDNGQLHVRISKGNVKVGNIPQFNTLPGDEPIQMSDGRALTNISGTCGKCCEGCLKECYAVRSLKLHHNSITRAWAENTLVLRNNPEKVKSEIHEYCTKNVVKYFRFHTSGEIESESQLKLYCEICEENPDIVFYIYTKQFPILTHYFVNERHAVPENLVINLSEWNGNINRFLETLNGCEQSYCTDVVNFLAEECNMFSYDDGSEPISTVHCPAIDRRGHETGVTCAMCRRCMKKGSNTAVYAH